jgi:hypothetical protein
MAKKNTKEPPRTVLVILSNRLTPLKKPRYVEVRCKSDGTILRETPLRSEPKEARFDEVWINDEGKPSMADCTRFKRHYRHRLQRPAD